MNTRILDPVSSLRRTPDNLDATLRGRPESWLDSRHADDIMTPRQVMGHLIKGEKEDWVPRIERILEHGESKAFDPFDIYAMNDYAQSTPIEEMLVEFRTLRIGNMSRIDALALSDEDLERKGTHPIFGVVTMDQLVHTWAAHDLYHLGQFYKSFASNMEGKVGPWQEFLKLPHFN